MAELPRSIQPGRFAASRRRALYLVLVVLAILPTVRAADAQWFRIFGPAVTRFLSINPNGYATWTNAPTNATFTIQMSSSLPGSSNWVDYIQVSVTNALTTNRLFDPNPPTGMVFIPGGWFQMGGLAASELPARSVLVSALYMDRFEVTKDLWDQVKGWSAGSGYSFTNPGDGKAGNHPAHSMTWYDAVKWCNARSEMEGKVPAYYTNAALTAVYRTGQVAPFVKWDAGYRLPTEAEWEKAARGGTTNLFSWHAEYLNHSRANYYSDITYPYDNEPVGGYHPDFDNNPQPYTSPSGYFPPNEYGLCDMAGNVREWCWDWYGAYPAASQTDPRGPAAGTQRVERGGSWLNSSQYPRSGARDAGLFGPGYGSWTDGFRSVLPATQ